MSLSLEECYVNKIESGIRSIKLGTKKPEEVKLYQSFESLKKLNDGLYNDLIKKYDNIVKDYKNKSKIIC